MKNRKNVKLVDSHKVNKINKKEYEVLNNCYLEFHVLCAIRKNLIKAVELAQQNNILYARNTIYARKGI